MTDLFAPQTIRRVIERFECVLTQLVAAPDALLGSIIGPTERRDLLQAFQGERRPDWGPQTLPAAFATVCEQVSERSAVIEGERGLMGGLAGAAAGWGGMKVTGADQKMGLLGKMATLRSLC